ncbi:hypothetical protein BcepSauron_023 [Burkholderia phage BcepSauron]|uniref:Uncharacterized protein n=1 Tax=Burkholderia phage BcepSauron TaxID=2530033 RepID=A0A482MMN3_9CAUD|nr:hypothetical protein H1O17_gp023 [Burkholderia phage BcepSauron]QBQ74403.1 hypothetical protein BcepSauron_023 [Burkholderia phage BcepSauron]
MAYKKTRALLRKYSAIQITPEWGDDPDDYTAVIGRRVIKRSGNKFRGGEVINTVTGVTINPHTDHPAFTFAEDDSIVDARTCCVVGLDYVEKGAENG